MVFAFPDSGMETVSAFRQGDSILVLKLADLFPAGTTHFRVTLPSTDQTENISVTSDVSDVWSQSIESPIPSAVSVFIEAIHVPLSGPEVCKGKTLFVFH